MGAVIIVDAFWGDAGKGKFSAYFSQTRDADICVRAGIGPNAGHSIHVDGRIIKTRLVPLGFMNRRTAVMIGSGVAVDPRILREEIRQTKTSGRIALDYRCPIIERRHIEQEMNDAILSEIDSTKSGAGAARADYIMRRCKRAGEIPSLKKYTRDVAEACNKAAKTGTVVVEGSQATYLSLYLSDRYPFTTSDNCTTAALIDDVGLNWRYVQEVVLLVKCLPTAVGNGPLPHEMSKEDIAERGLVEYGVNTGRMRRRSTHIDLKLLKYSVMLNGPTEIALTFCDQYDRRIEGVTDKALITKDVRRLLRSVEKAAGIPVRYLDTGKDFGSIVALW